MRCPLYFVFYNFVRTHKAHKLSPAMAAGVVDKLWSIEDIDAPIEVRRSRASADPIKKPPRSRGGGAATAHPTGGWEGRMFDNQNYVG
jgi:hypothetical protein